MEAEMKLTEYRIKNKKFPGKYVFALISDLHGDDPEEIIEILKNISPDFILAPGDIFEPLDGSQDKVNEAGFRLLSSCAEIAPTFFSPGNHEVGGTRSWSLKWKFPVGRGKNYSSENIARLAETGVTFLDDTFVVRDGFAFGGLGSGLINAGGKPELNHLSDFCRCDHPKILLCHHPEYYEKYLRDYDIDLIVSGHAHGGQWRFFGRGVFAPGQGIFPKYTSGVHDGKLVISRGLKKSRRIPRIFNPPEVVKIIIEPQ